MLATYHNHSTFSDGKHSPAELVRYAATQGIDELGISDHYVVRADGRIPDWSMSADALPTYFSELTNLRAARRDSGQPVLRIGLEVDWFPGHEELLRRTLGALPVDYVLGSVHYVDDFTIDGSPAQWQKRSEQQRNDAHRHYWRHMISLAGSGVFDIVAHIDLPKKFGFYPTIDLSKEINAALDAIAAQEHLVVELNTAGWHKPCADAYPSENIVAGCFQRGIPMTISADAHQGEHLLRDFDRAAQRLQQAGYTQIARFADRQVRMEPLDQCVRASH